MGGPAGEGTGNGGREQAGSLVRKPLQGFKSLANFL